ncbi:hypothetical protein CALVIDRAFT_244418 [Calocera viscosa TUFC12733]|uniref:Uncharacterized protein n=1 Tax=Calocera viscosa (strain TUFC12733) TaxID=1330018 RepID=A0A167JGI5_CALVF|nr:hypothetical protein CALVIDRAFT_244418 [Calocera viscosa TUFC12733]
MAHLLILPSAINPPLSLRLGPSYTTPHPHGRIAGLCSAPRARPTLSSRLARAAVRRHIHRLPIRRCGSHRRIKLLPCQNGICTVQHLISHALSTCPVPVPCWVRKTTDKLVEPRVCQAVRRSGKKDGRRKTEGLFIGYRPRRSSGASCSFWPISGGRRCDAASRAEVPLRVLSGQVTWRERWIVRRRFAQRFLVASPLLGATKNLYQPPAAGWSAAMPAPSSAPLSRRQGSTVHPSVTAPRSPANNLAEQGIVIQGRPVLVPLPSFYAVSPFPLGIPPSYGLDDTSSVLCSQSDTQSTIPVPLIAGERLSHVEVQVQSSRICSRALAALHSTCPQAHEGTDL